MAEFDTDHRSSILDSGSFLSMVYLIN